MNKTEQAIKEQVEERFGKMNLFSHEFAAVKEMIDFEIFLDQNNFASFLHTSFGKFILKINLKLDGTCDRIISFDERGLTYNDENNYDHHLANLNYKQTEDGIFLVTDDEKFNISNN